MSIKQQFLLRWKSEIVGSIVILLCLLLTSFFPTKNILEDLCVNLFIFLILPVLYIRLLLKKNVSDFGFNLEHKLNGLLWAFIMLIISFLIIFVFFYFFNFEQKYLVPAYLAENFWWFLFYELLLANFVLFINEFFFKGFVLFLFDSKFGSWAIIIQSLIFILFLSIMQTIDWQVVPAIILSLTGGIVSYRSRSFIYSYAMSLFFLIILDAYIIYLFK